MPKDLGIKVSKTLFAPRLGGHLPDQRQQCHPGGLRRSPTTLCRSRARCAVSSRSRSRPRLRRREPYGWATTFEEGIPDVVGPDLSSGRLDLPPLPDANPSGDVSRSRIHSWNISFERRLPWDVSVDIAYVGTAKNGGFTDIDANASDVPGGGATSRPLYRHPRQLVAPAVGPVRRSRGTTRSRWPSTGRSRTGCC